MAVTAELVKNTGTPPADSGGLGETNMADPVGIKQDPKTPKILIRPGTPDNEEAKKVGQVVSLFNRAKEYRRPLVSLWNECYRMMDNQYWNSSYRAGWLPSPQLPEIRPIIDALVAWEMDQGPEYDISPAALPHSDFSRFFANMANDLEVVMNSSYINNAEKTEWAKSQWDKYRYGTGIIKTVWDQTLAGGMGDAVTQSVSPYYFFPDPAATCMKDSNYFVEYRRLSIQDLDRRWPGTAALFPSGGVERDGDTPPTQLDFAGQNNAPRVNSAAIPPATSPRYGPSMSAHRRLDDIELPEVTVLECWVREHETYKAQDINTGDPVTKVVDCWRVMVVAGDRLIMDEPAENLWEHGQHPYDRLVIRDEGEFWGKSMVHLLLSTQKSYNRILAAMQQNAEIAGNPILKQASNQSRTQMTNRPGSVIPVAPQNMKDTDWLQVPQMSQAHTFLLNYFREAMERIAGLSAVMKGNSPAGRNAEGVIDALQEASFVRIRSSLTFFEDAMRNAGQKKADLIIQNYSTPRLISIAGPGGERTSLALKGFHFQIPTSKGKTPLRYQLLVDVGSQQHTSRAMRESMEKWAFTVGLTDRQAALEGINYPNAAEVARRMDEKEQQMAAQGASVGPGKRQSARA